MLEKIGWYWEHCTDVPMVQSHLSGNSRVVWTNDDQIGPDGGSLWLHIHAGRHNIESFRLDVESLQEVSFISTKSQRLRVYHLRWWASQGCLLA